MCGTGTEYWIWGRWEEKEEGGLTVWLHNVGWGGGKGEYVRSVRLLGIYGSVQGVNKKQRMKGLG